MNSNKSLLMTKIAIGSTFSLVFLFSQVMPSYIQQEEYFPFFSWSLFSETSTAYQQYYLYLPPEECKANECPFIGEFRPKEELYWKIQKLGWYSRSTDSDLYSAREDINTLLFSSHPNLNYQLRVKIFDPVHYLSNRVVHNDILINSHTSTSE